MKTRLILLAAVLLSASSATALTTTWKEDGPDGVELIISGTGLPAGGWELESPSGIWSFPFTSLYAAFDQHDPLVLAMYFDVGLKHADHPQLMLNRAFNDYFIFGPEPFGSPERPGFLLDGTRSEHLVVRESFAFGPAAFEFWRAENFLRVDARPRLMDPASWEWTFFASFVAPERVPDAGSTLGLLVMALGGLGFMRRAC